MHARMVCTFSNITPQPGPISSRIPFCVPVRLPPAPRITCNTCCVAAVGRREHPRRMSGSRGKRQSLATVQPRSSGSACSGCQLATARTSTALAPSLPHLKLRAPPSSWASQLAAPPVREPPISGCAAVVPAPSSDHGAYTTSAPSQSRPQYAPLSTRDGCAS